MEQARRFQLLPHVRQLRLVAGIPFLSVGDRNGSRLRSRRGAHHVEAVQIAHFAIGAIVLEHFARVLFDNEAELAAAGDVAEDEHVSVAFIFVEPRLDLVHIDVCAHCVT